jgi:hypothetical protein
MEWHPFATHIQYPFFTGSVQNTSAKQRALQSNSFSCNPAFWKHWNWEAVILKIISSQTFT